MKSEICCMGYDGNDMLSACYDGTTAKPGQQQSRGVSVLCWMLSFILACIADPALIYDIIGSCM